jgi:hypothetical protein
VPVSVRTISAVVADSGSGVAGGTISVGSGGSFTALATTLRGGRLVATVPGTLSPSRVAIRVSAGDRAGNVVTRDVTSLSLATRVGSGRVRTVRRARATVGYGRVVRVSGRLTTADGAAVSDAPLLVSSVLRRTGARTRELAAPRTDGTGRFSFRVPAGPSRELAVTYAGSSSLLARRRSLTLRVPASSTIHASSRSLSGAGTIRFSGRLGTRGTSIPSGGKIVELQASQRGRWSTVATTRARPGWSAVARFRGTPGRYPVRLRIRREAAFGYELGYSPAVVVTVR